MVSMLRTLVLAAAPAMALVFASMMNSTLAQDGTPDLCPVTTKAENAEGTNNRTPEALRDILAPEVIHHTAGGYAVTAMADAVVARMSEFPPAFSDLHYSIDFLVADDDTVVERHTAIGTNDDSLGGFPPTGRTLIWTGIDNFRIVCGKIAKIWSGVDTLSRNAQLASEANATLAP